MSARSVIREPAPDHPGFVVKVDEDGKRAIGKLVGREFHVMVQRPR